MSWMRLIAMKSSSSFVKVRNTASKIPVVFITDNNYALPTGVAIQSLISTKNKDTRYDIYVICNKVEEKLRTGFNEFELEGVQIHVIEPNTDHLLRYSSDGHITSTGLLKFDIAELLPQYDKVLYLDGDILVQKDLTDLYNTDLKNTFVGAVLDKISIVAREYCDKLGIKKYFNSGVMLLNAKKLRNEKIKEKLYNIKEIYPEYSYQDQDVLNVVFEQNVTWLPLAYNLVYSTIVYRNWPIDFVNDNYETSYASYEELSDAAVVIHMLGERKPWKYKDTFIARKWHDYFDQSPFEYMRILLLEDNIYEVRRLCDGIHAQFDDMRRKIEVLEEKLKLPRWFGKFISNLIPNRKNRHIFREHHVRKK
jgi:lipopolysaccharide biosynthesis glycosyltransferase